MSRRSERYLTPYAVFRTLLRGPGKDSLRRGSYEDNPPYSTLVCMSLYARCLFTTAVRPTCVVLP